MPFLPLHGQFVSYHETDLAVAFRQIDYTAAAW